MSAAAAATPTPTVFQPVPASRALETAAAWLLGALWILPLAYAVWTAFHPAAYSTRFEIGAPLTLQNFVNALINSVRMVDHLFVMTRGGPDNASALLLYYIYQVGFSFWDTGYAAALTVVVLAALGLVAFFQIRFLDRRTHYQ